MLENLSNVELAAPVVVSLLVIVRLYAGDIVFDTKYTKLWNVARRVLVPLLDTVVKPRLGVSVTNTATQEEFVGAVDDTPQEVVRKLNKVGDFEVSILSGYKTDWADRTEAASIVSYHGDRPFPHAPDWLQNRQLHITMFRESEANPQTIITAHEEANSWRPDQWHDHLFRTTQSAEEGVRRTKALLDQTSL